MERPPQRTTGDSIHAVVKSMASASPTAGGPLGVKPRMHFLRAFTLMLLALSLSGCALGFFLNPNYAPEKYSDFRGSKDGFGFALAYDRFNELGGKDTKEFATFIQQISIKKKLCPNGIKSIDTSNQWGYVAVGVSCVELQ